MEKGIEKVHEIKRRKEMPQDWQDLREKVLENFKSRTEGLDLERVAEFVWSHNLPVSDFILLYEEDIPELELLLEGMPGLSEINNDFCGRFLPEIDLIFIKRDSKMEKINGPIYGEGQIIHEQVHASAERVEYIETEDFVDQPRSGFVLPLNKKFKVFSPA